MRKLSIFFFGMLLCMAVCFTAYADVIIPGQPYTGPARPSTTVVEVSEKKSVPDESAPTDPVSSTAPTSKAPTSTTAPDDNGGGSSIQQRLHAVWGAVVAAVFAIAAFISQLFHKK